MNTHIPARKATSLLAVGLVLSLAACGGGGGHAKPKETPAEKAAKLIQDGSQLAAKNNVAAAMKDFSKAAKVDPSDAVAYYDLGVGYTDEQKDAAAQIAFNKAIAFDSKYTSAMYDLAILDTTKQPQEAVALYERILKIKPNGPDVLYNLGLLLDTLGHKTAGNADIAKAEQIDPSLASGATTTTTGK